MKHYLLNNGCNIVTTRISDSKVATLLVLVKTGSINDSVPGIAHFIEHTIFKGTDRRNTAGKINYEVERMGGYLNAATSQEFTEYYIKIPSSYIESAFDILSDILFNSTYTSSELEKEKDVVVEEINMYEDTPVRSVSDKFYYQIWKDKPLGRTILGTPTTVKSIQREDIINFISQFYTPQNMIISFCGDLEDNRLLDLCNKYFGSINLKPSVTISAKDELEISNNSIELFSNNDLSILCEDKDLKQIHLCLGIEALSYSDNRSSILEIMGGIMAEGSASFLWQKIREELGASYYLNSEIDNFRESGVWYIHTGVEKDKLSDVIKILFAGYKKLQTGDITSEELDRAKEYVKADLVMNLEGTEELARYYCYEFFENGKISDIQDKLDLLSNVSISEIADLASSLVKNKFYLSLLGDTSDIDSLKNISLNSLNSLKN